MKKFMAFIIFASIFTNSCCDSLKEYKEAIGSVNLESFKDLLNEKHKAFLLDNDWKFGEHTFLEYSSKTINDELILQYCNDFQTLDSCISQCSVRNENRLKELAKPESTRQRVSKYIMPLTCIGLGSLFYYYSFHDLKNYFSAFTDNTMSPFSVPKHPIVRLIYSAFELKKLFSAPSNNLQHSLLYFVSGTILNKYGYSLYGERTKSVASELKALRSRKNNLDEMNKILKSVEISFSQHINSMKSNFKVKLSDNAAKALSALVSSGLG